MASSSDNRIKATPQAGDDWRTVVSSILLAKTAVATFAIAPFLIGGYIDHLHLSAAQAGRALSIEIFALALSNALAVFWVHKATCRSWAQRFLLLLVALSICCIYAPSIAALMGLRALIGVVEGALLALGFGLLGKTVRPNRNFGLYFAISLSIGAINIRVLPLFLESSGVTGLFVNLSLYAVIALLGSVWIRRSAMTSSISQRSQPFSFDFGIALLPLLFLVLANYVYFVGQGGVWSFLERIGGQQGFELTGIASALSLSLFAGVAGGATAGWLDLKLGRVFPLVAAIGLALLSVALFFVSSSVAVYTVAACLFNYANNMGHPYVLGFAAALDDSSRLTVLSGALHTAGQATGPIIAGMIVVGGDFTNVLWLGLASFFLTLLLFVPVALSNDKP